MTPPRNENTPSMKYFFIIIALIAMWVMAKAFFFTERPDINLTVKEIEKRYNDRVDDLIYIKIGDSTFFRHDVDTINDVMVIRNGSVKFKRIYPQ